MPRIYTSANDARDYCERCYPTEKGAEQRYGNVAKTGEGPDGRGNCFSYDAEHPDYEREDYTCIVCKKKLGEQDN